MKKWKSAEAFLEHLNATYASVHYAFEKNFWVTMMGDHSLNLAKNKALAARDAFSADVALAKVTDEFFATAKGELKERLGYWKRFFSLHQIPEKAVAVKKKIDELQTKIETLRASRKEGYVDPYTKKFVAASSNKMRSMMVSDPDEKIRKACFDAREKMSLGDVSKYIKLVGLRNQYARLLGYEDFYAYKLAVEEEMTKKELFSLLEEIHSKTKYAFADVRTVETETMPGLRKPWNFSYMLSGSFVKEEDPYFPFEAALERWGKSFAALGIAYRGGSLALDLLDRKGKYNNGFCHWPMNVHYKKGKRVAGQSNFTCNVVLGIPGNARQGYNTLFHEGGHAAHLLNANMKDICVTTEYPPLSTAWAETQSMFLDTVFSSIEWTSRYAKTLDGKEYPFDIYERKVKKVGFIRPLGILRAISEVCEFEKRVYEAKELTREKIFSTAKAMFKKYYDMSVVSYDVLETPHLYSWESACSYHGYGLATLALDQWRQYFYKKYGYIVDNPKVGMEMREVWKYGGAKTFPELVKLATGKKLSATAYIENVTMTDEQTIKRAKESIATLRRKQNYAKEVELDAHIALVDGKKTIADSKKGFDAMTKKYAAWLKTKYQKTS